jgi:hypothetical protein
MEEVAKKLSVVKENFGSTFIFFTVPDELAYIFSVLVPVKRGGNMLESVAFTIEENVPLALGDAIFDFTPAVVTGNAFEYRANLVVVACMKKEVEKFVEVIYASGLTPVGCIHESQAIARALIPKGVSGTVCIIHARKNRVGIYLVKGNVVYFSTIRSVLEGDFKSQFLDEYEKFLEYSMKYGVSEEVIENVLVCGEFEYAKKAVEAVGDGRHAAKNPKLGNVWSNLLRIDKNVPSISYENSLELAGPIGTILSDII